MTNTNSRLAQRALSFFVLVALVAGSMIPTFAQTRRTTRRRAPRLGTYRRPAAQQPANTSYYTVRAGETIRVRMNEQISSETARVGDRFTTKTVDPVYAGGTEVIPAGSTIMGRVTSVTRAQGKSKAGSMAVGFYQVELPTGVRRPINGSLTDAQSSSVSNDNEGSVSGRSSAKRNAVFIGGGAAGGALIGAIAGGGKGAGIGALLGGGLGAAGAVFSKGKEAVVKRDTEFGVILNQSVSLPASNVR